MGDILQRGILDQAGKELCESFPFQSERDVKQRYDGSGSDVEVRIECGMMHSE